jgi:hypothetical protein
VEQHLKIKSSTPFNLMNFVLGLWTVLSAPVLGFSNQNAAGWNNAIVGLAVLILALMRTTIGYGPSIANAVLGIWLIISPFALGFANFSAALWNNIILGVVICFAALMASRRRSES